MKHTFNYKTNFRILKGGKISMVVAAFLAGATMSFASPATNALPTNGNVVNGNVNISTNANTMNINQASNKSIINWNTYNIGKDSTVNYNFAQTNSSSLNRVTSNNPSEIYGNLNANGKVILVNPNGVVFGKGSSVNVGSIVATTMNVKDSDYLNDKQVFTRDNAIGSIVNEGTITAQEKGYIALLSPKVLNEGVIRAVKGSVSLAGADKIELTLDSSGLKTVIVEPSTIETLIENKSLVEADGGIIYIGVKQAAQLLDTAMNIKNSGTLQANSMDDLLGKVTLDGDNIEVSGTIQAKEGVVRVGNQNNNKTIIKSTANLEGNFVETSGKSLKVEDGVTIKAKEWLLDPYDITVASSGTETLSGTPATTSSTTGNVTVSAATIQTQLNAGTSVLLDATNNITVNQDISKTAGGDATLTFKAGGNIILTPPDLEQRKIISTAGKLNLVFWSNSDGTNGGNINLGKSNFKTNGGHFWAGGSATSNGSTTWNGLTVGDGYAKGTSNTNHNGILINTLSLNTMNTRDTALGNVMLKGEGFEVDNTSQNNGSGISSSEMIILGGVVTLDGKIKSNSNNSYLYDTYQAGLQFRGTTYIYGFTNTEEASINLIGDASGGTNYGGMYGITSVRKGEEVPFLYLYTYDSQHNFNKGSVSIKGTTATSNGTKSTGVLIEKFKVYTNKELKIEGTASYTNINPNGTNSIRSIDITYGEGRAGYINAIGNNYGIYFSAPLLELTDSTKINEFNVINTNPSGVNNDFGIGVFIGNTNGTINASAPSGITLWSENNLIVKDVVVSGTINNPESYSGVVDYGTVIKGKINLSSENELKLLDGGEISTVNKSYEAITVNAGHDWTTGNIGYTGVLKDLGTTFTVGDGGNILLYSGSEYFIHPQYPDQRLYETIISDPNKLKITDTYFNSDETTTSLNTTIYNSSNKVFLIYRDGPKAISIPYTLSTISGYTYNGTSQLPTQWLASSIFGSTYSSWIAGTDYKFIYNNQAVTGFTDAGTYSNISIDILKSGFNEATTGNTNGTFTISPFALTLGDFSASNKVYDGLASATVTGTLNKFGSDDVTLVGEFNNKNAGVNKTVTASLTGAKASNYTLGSTPVTTTADISKLVLTNINGFTASNKVYDGNKTATADSTNVVYNGKLSADTLNISSSTNEFDNKDAGTGKTVSISNIVLGGTDANNYELPQNFTTTALADITKKDISNLILKREYDGTTVIKDNISAESSDIVVGENLTITGEGSVFSKNASITSQSVTLGSIALADGTDGSLASNYNLIATPTVLIGKKALNVNGLTVSSKTYDGTNSATLLNEGTINKIGNDDVSFSTVATFNNENVETTKTVNLDYTLSGNDAINYTLSDASSVATNAKINAKTLTVSGLTVSSKIYDGSNSATVLTAGTIDKILNDDVSFTTVATFNNENVETTKTVNLDYTLSGTKAGNYTLVDDTSVATNAKINAKTLTVSGLTVASKTYDGSNSATVLTSGTINKVLNDDVSFTTVATFNNENVETTKTVNLDYTLSGTKAGNYTLVDDTSVATNARINAKLLTVSGLTVSSKTYDGTNSATLLNEGTINKIGNDDVSFSTVATFNNENVETTKTVNLDYTLSGTKAGNYTLVDVTTQNTAALINKIPLKYSIKDIKLIAGGKLELPQPEFESTQFFFNPQYEIKVIDKNGKEVEDINKLPVGKYKIKVVNFNDVKYMTSDLSKDGEIVVNPASNPDAIIENSIKITNIEKTKLEVAELKEKIVSSNDKKLNIDEKLQKVSLDNETVGISNDKTQLVSEISFESNPFVSNSLITIENGGVKDVKENLNEGVKTQKEEAKTKEPINNVVLTSTDLNKNSIIAKVNFDKNNNFSFTIKEAITVKMKPEDIKDIKATLSNGQILPNWLKFDKNTQTFLAINPPAGSLPIATKVIFKDSNKEEIIAVEITK